MGRLTRDPDVRAARDGMLVLSFSLAVDRRFKREGQPQADFFNCACFGKSAEAAEKYFTKGLKILVDGEIQNGNYTDRNGVKHYSVSILVNQWEFAESKGSRSAEEDEENDGSWLDLGDEEGGLFDN